MHGIGKSLKSLSKGIGRVRLKTREKVLVILLVIVLLGVIPVGTVVPVSNNPCIAPGCHGASTGYFETIDLLESDPANDVPASIEVGQTQQVKVGFYCEASVYDTSWFGLDYNTLQTIDVTLASQNGYFTIDEPVFSLADLRVLFEVTDYAFWNITGLTEGTDYLEISVEALTEHEPRIITDTFATTPEITIVKSSVPVITLTTSEPSGSLLAGDTFTLEWNIVDQNPSTATVDLYYSTDGFASSNVTIATTLPNTGSYDWTLPDLDATISIMAIVTNDKSKAALDLLPYDITIASNIPLAITLTSTPPGGAMEGGSNFLIEWVIADNDPSSAMITLYYSTDGFASSNETIVSALSNTGSYLWTLPGEDITVSVLAMVTNSALEKSFFLLPYEITITTASAPTISITSVEPTRALFGGETFKIEWDATDQDLAGTLVTLYYSTDNFTSSNVTIVSDISGTGEYIWTLPEIDANVSILAQINNTHSLYSYSLLPFYIMVMIYIPPYLPPTAIATIDTPVAGTGEPVAFNSSMSLEGNSTSYTLIWDFGDGTTAVQTTPGIIDHQYSEPGSYTVRLIADDGNQATEAYLDIEITKASTGGDVTSSAASSALLGLIATIIGLVLVIISTVYTGVVIAKGRRREREIKFANLQAASRMYSRNMGHRYMAAGYGAYAARHPRPLATSMRPEISKQMCVMCDQCINRCPSNAISKDQQGHPVINYSLCTQCGVCEKVCDSNAIRMTPVQPQQQQLGQQAGAQGQAYGQGHGYPVYNQGAYYQNQSYDGQNIAAADIQPAPKRRPKKYPLLDKYSCSGCAECENNCPPKAITVDEFGYPVINYDSCKGCGLCAKKCKSNALEMVMAGELFEEE